MHRLGKTGWHEKLKVQVAVNPRKRPYVTEMGKLLRWLRKMGVNEYIEVEWVLFCSIEKKKKQGMEKWWRCSELLQGGRLMRRCSKTDTRNSSIS